MALVEGFDLLRLLLAGWWCDHGKGIVSVLPFKQLLVSGFLVGSRGLGSHLAVVFLDSGMELMEAAVWSPLCNMARSYLHRGCMATHNLISCFGCSLNMDHLGILTHVCFLKVPDLTFDFLCVWVMIMRAFDIPKSTSAPLVLGRIVEPPYMQTTNTADWNLASRQITSTYSPRHLTYLSRAIRCYMLASYLAERA